MAAMESEGIVRLAGMALLVLGACGHAPAVGRGGDLYSVTIESVNGRHTSTRGHLSFSAMAIQVGDRMARVWLADEHVESPAILQGDAAALKAGVMLERSWNEAVVHHVTDDELAVGVAVVYVPGVVRPAAMVELRFERVPRPGPAPGG